MLQDKAMHSGADVDAVAAELSGDLEGNSSSSQEICSNTVYVSSQQKQPLSASDNQQCNIDVKHSQEVRQAPLQQKQDVMEQSILQPSISSQFEIYENSAQHVPESGVTPISEQKAQHSKLQHMNQQATTSDQGSNSVNKYKKVLTVDLLVPLLSHQLDKERTMKLDTVYLKLKKKEITKDVFLPLMRSIVGDEIFKAVDWKFGARSKSQIPSALQLAGNDGIVRKPIIGHKKQVETSSPPSSSKKQKVSGGSLDPRIMQLNDVTAISGIDLVEEEDHLFSGSKKNSHVLEASCRVAREEEEKFILQRAPLQKKLEGIKLKCGVKSISNNVEQCLSMCVEEIMRQMIRNLIRQSKQRIDIKKPKDRSFIASDISQQILLMNQKSKEELGKKQAEIERMQKLRELQSSPASDGVDEKEEGREKTNKANNEESKKMRTTAANAAARAAVGGNDMQSKWQLMAELAQQKHGGSSDAASSQPSVSGRSRNNIRGREMMGSSAGGVAPGSARKLAKAQASVTPAKVDRSISVKDVIAVLEKDPQMAKSTLLYRLYNKVCNPDSSSEPRALSEHRLQH